MGGAVEFLKADHDPDLLKPFFNTVLAEPWTGDVGELDEAELLRRTEPFGLNGQTDDGAPRPFPSEVMFITVGTDVQDDRLEVTIVGWSATQCFVLEHVVLWGVPDDDRTWRQHDELIRKRWKHPLGGMIGVEATAVDSGDGDWTEEVYRYCFPRYRTMRVHAIKGVGGSRPAFVASKTLVQDRHRLWIVGVDGVKSRIAAWLARGEAVRFADSLDAAYFEQLTAERKILKRSKGQPYRVWDRIPGRRAETLDCLVYAVAVRQHFAIDFDSRAAALTIKDGQRPAARPAPQVARPVRRVTRSSYMTD